MSEFHASIVICGAGIAGIATAFQLAVVEGVPDVVVVDPRAPLSLTSDKSTECYRNWWPGPDRAMIDLMNRSYAHLLAWRDESGDRFHLNQRGYLYLSREPETVARWRQQAQRAEAQGAGPLRVHEGRAQGYVPCAPHGVTPDLDGADLLLGRALHHQYPYLDPELVAGLHVRRAGWLSAQQLGMWLWEEARARGARLIEGEVTGVTQAGGRVSAVEVEARGQSLHLATGRLVLAAGPHARQVASLVGVDLPLYSELHAKIAIQDHRRAVPRAAPRLISDDMGRLPWSADERTMLADEPALRWLLEPLPAGAHLRPDGGSESRTLLLLWPYHSERHDAPHFPCDFGAVEPEVVLRGLSMLVPALRAYVERLPRPVIDGGYYTRTAENRPLIGPLPVEGAYLIGALSGYGIMAAPAAAELLADHILGHALPPYARAFALARYDDPDYAGRMAAAADGQL